MVRIGQDLSNAPGKQAFHNALLGNAVEQDAMHAARIKGRKLGKRSRHELLAFALARKFDMLPEDAQEVARIVDDTFGTETEVNDDNLDPETRSIFYTLEAKRLLSFRREEYEWETGEKRRAFFWRFREEEVERADDEPEPEMADDIYATLPADVWRRVQA